MENDRLKTIKNKKLYLIIFIASCFSQCVNKNKEMNFLTTEIPDKKPIPFKQALTPEGKLIHKGIFSPDLNSYYFTISDKGFEKFDVYFIEKINGEWSEPQMAFFNTEYSEHGMSFAPDGNSIYFSSTRPSEKEGIADTWHIWRSIKHEGKWNEPEFIDIPNLRDKLVSHPTVTNEGTIYFHSSKPDYSEMDIYYTKQTDGKFQEAQKLSLSEKLSFGKCTPHVATDGNYLIFSEISNQLDLWITFNDGHDNWINARKLDSLINTNGQGNPYITPDNKYLFYTTGKSNGENWQVNWVNIASELGH